eukprot:6698381-Prymnesium_polylepis.1
MPIQTRRFSLSVFYGAAPRAPPPPPAAGADHPQRATPRTWRRQKHIDRAHFHAFTHLYCTLKRAAWLRSQTLATSRLVVVFAQVRDAPHAAHGV